MCRRKKNFGGTSLPCTVSRDHRDFASHMHNIVWNSIIGSQYATPGLKLPGRSRLSRILNYQLDIQQIAKHQTVNPSPRELIPRVEDRRDYAEINMESD
jgi:hypothetical protein